MAQVGLAVQAVGKRRLKLSITHIFGREFEAERDVGQARHATPEYGVAGRAVGRAIEVACGATIWMRVARQPRCEW